MAHLNLQLVKPQTKYEGSFLAAFKELSESSDQFAWIYLGESNYENFFRMSFAEYVETLLKREFTRPPNFVCDNVYWAILDDEVVGRISIRHELNDFLRTAGGHIGFITRPSYRKQGIASEMLNQLLKTDRAKAIGHLLVTCDETNLASEKVILSAGGKLENIVEWMKDRPRKRRFWIHLNREFTIDTPATPDLKSITSFYESCGYFSSLNGSEQFLLAKCRDDIIGAVRLVFENETYLLRGMFTRVDWQRLGVGQQMLKAFERLLSERNITQTFLICGAHLGEFYGKIGFSNVTDPNKIPPFIRERSSGYKNIHGPQLILCRTKD